jgi:hypothetical protein
MHVCVCVCVYVCVCVCAVPGLYVNTPVGGANEGP